MAERGISVFYETVPRWVNHFGPKIAADLRKRRPNPILLGIWTRSISRSTVGWSIYGGGWTPRARRQTFWSQSRRNKHAALKLMRELLKKYGVMPDKIVTDDLRSHAAAALELGISDHRKAGDGATIGRRIRISKPDEGRGRCKGSKAWDPRKDFSQRMQPHITPSTSNVISRQQEHTEPSGRRPCGRGVKSSPRDCCSGFRRCCARFSIT